MAVGDMIGLSKFRNGWVGVGESAWSLSKGGTPGKGSNLADGFVTLVWKEISIKPVLWRYQILGELKSVACFLRGGNLRWYVQITIRECEAWAPMV